MPKYSVDASEMKGLLIKNMDENLVYKGNKFYETLTRGSSGVFTETLEERKKSKRGTSKNFNPRPMTSSSKNFTNKSRITFANIPFITHHDESGEKNDSILAGTTEKFDKREVNLVKMVSNQAVLNEIEDFERKFCHGEKKVGYPKVALHEAYRLSSAQGLTSAIEIQSKKKEAVARLNT